MANLSISVQSDYMDLRYNDNNIVRVGKAPSGVNLDFSRYVEFDYSDVSMEEIREIEEKLSMLGLPVLLTNQYKYRGRSFQVNLEFGTHVSLEGMVWK